MGMEYEHEGVVYHEPLPRVLLVNFQTAGRLKDKGHNAKPCVIERVDAEPTENYLRSPVPPHEVDIFLLRDRGGEEILSGRAAPGRVPPTRIVTFSSIITIPSRQELLSDFCRQVLMHGGACVFFVSEAEGQLLRSAVLAVTPDPTKKLWPGRSAHRLPEPEKCFEPLRLFVSRWLNDAPVYVGFVVDRKEVPETPTDLLEDSAGNSYAVAYRYGRIEKSGLVICLPDYGERDDILHSLLSEALPQLAPHLFPFRQDLSWMKEPQFRHPKTVVLEANKETVRQEAQKKLDALEAKIQALEESEKFMRELLTTAGEQLKDAVKQSLQTLFAAAGIAGVNVIDADTDPVLRDDSTHKREDLRIEWEGDVFLLDVAGREQYFRPTSINQLDRHHREFLQANPGLPSASVHCLLIGNFNYAGGLDPRKRGEMFGTGTADARERLVEAGHGVIGTFDLYRVIRTVQRNEAVLTAASLLRLLRTEGILDFDTFQASLTRPGAMSG